MSIRPTVRVGVGVLLVIYSVYGLAKPAFKPRKVGAAADGSIGFLNGVLGGLTGLPGFIITVWCQMRGWTKDEQRAVFQPVILAGMIDDRNIAERRRRHHDRYAQAVCARSSRAAGRLVAGLQMLRQAR